MDATENKHLGTASWAFVCFLSFKSVSKQQLRYTKKPEQMYTQKHLHAFIHIKKEEDGKQSSLMFPLDFKCLAHFRSAL